ncbi:DUF5941 domain-containing protein, partial [Trebonia sp.]|uniref:DUF5941 domain-containing protein n=1 Tax=Trebonia sp. TaxID=2767075 RepID=UPI00260AEE1B
GLGGPGADGVWRLAAAAAIALGLLQIAELSLAATGAVAVRARRIQAFAGAPGGARLLVIGAAALLAGARVAFAVQLLLCVLAFAALLAGKSGEGPAAAPGWLPGYRGDGPLAVWIGRFVDGKLPPLPPLLVGLLVTGMLAGLGLHNLPGILVLTPVEAMMLAALASWHPHDGRRDWLAPPLLQAGEYVFLAALGFADRAWAPVTFALLAAVMLRHLELAYRVRTGLVPVPDRRGLGWEGRMILAGLAALAGIVPVIYPLLAVYLWGLLGWDWAVGWSRSPS